MSRLTAKFAETLACIALGHVAREYPNILQHTLSGPGEWAEPHELHPAFYGSYDWHSCVHGHWMLARLLRRFPDLESAAEIRSRFDAAFTQSAIAGEVAYFNRPGARGYERPYGWAWLLKLAAELAALEGDDGARWCAALAPLAAIVEARFMAFLPKADYPVRAGTHGNTAFALALASDYASAPLRPLIQNKARQWYSADADCQAWEPSGDDFLSGALVEAELMRRLLAAADFRAWFAQFLPRVGQGAPASLFTPARVSDPGDGKIAHLDGLNLSRAWCWRGIASSLDAGDPARSAALGAAQTHLDASLGAVAGDYMGEHWLASFAVLALDEV